MKDHVSKVIPIILIFMIDLNRKSTKKINPVLFLSVLRIKLKNFQQGLFGNVLKYWEKLEVQENFIMSFTSFEKISWILWIFLKNSKKIRCKFFVQFVKFIKILKKYSRKLEFWVNCDKRMGKFQRNCKKFNETQKTPVIVS